MENKSSYQINEQGVLGEVKIADDVIAVIAGIAATEVTGVARMCGNITNELVSKLGVNNLSKGVKVVVENHHVRVNLALELDYGVSIPEISKKVQDRVKVAIENMTGLKVREVNVRVRRCSRRRVRKNIKQSQTGLIAVPSLYRRKEP